MTSDSELGPWLNLTRRTKTRWLVGIAALASALCVTPTLWAEEGQPPEVDVEMRSIARDLAVQGAEAYEIGQYELALDRFDRAAALIEAPSITIMQARCLVALGRWVEGLDHYHQTSQFPVTEGAPEAFVLAQTQAQEEAAVLEEKMPRLEVRLSGAGQGADGVVVRLDGKELPAVLLNVGRPIDPGAHTIEISAHGAATVEQLLMAEGERSAVTLQVPASRPEPEPVPAQSSPPPVQESRSPFRDWAQPVAFGVGAVGAVGAVWSGLRASDEQKRLDDRCDPGCPNSEADTLSSYRSHRSLFFVSAAVAVVGLSAGTYFAVTDGQEPVVVSVTPLGASVRGHF